MNLPTTTLISRCRNGNILTGYEKVLGRYDSEGRQSETRLTDYWDCCQEQGNRFNLIGTGEDSGFRKKDDSATQPLVWGSSKAVSISSNSAEKGEEWVVDHSPERGRKRVLQLYDSN